MLGVYEAEHEELLQEIACYRKRYEAGRSILERKRSYATLEELAMGLEPSQFCLEIQGWHFECLYQRGEDLGENLYVMFNGKRLPEAELPRFVRWSYFGLKQGTMLTIDDPMCYRFRSLRLGWLYGSEDQSLAALAVELVKAVCVSEGRPYRNVVFFGSSGGGYDAIYCSSLLPGSLSISLNPQLVLKNFPYGKEFSAKTGISLEGEDPLGRKNLAKVLKGSQSHHAILANASSQDDIVGHILPLCHSLGIKPCFGLTLAQNLLLWIYDCPGSGSGPHNSVETKHNFDFIVDIALKFRNGTLGREDAVLAKSMGELWQELFAYKKKSRDDRVLMESFTGLSLENIPPREIYPLGSAVQVRVASSCLDMRDMNFAWWVYRNNKCIHKLPYAKDRELNLILPPPSERMTAAGSVYVVRCYLKNLEGKVFTMTSNRIILES